MPGDAPWWIARLTGLGVRADTALAWAAAFETVMAGVRWRDPLMLPNFMAQALHESAMLTRLEENLSYSAVRLMQVWPQRFATLELAQPCAHNPRALAEKVYGARMGNREPGDSWKYRGRGLIQITGRDNYALAQELTGLELVDNPDLLLQPEPALRASVAWWNESVPAAALKDVALVTRCVNGATTGLAERERLTNLALDTWGVSA